jgi:hypothetical protein
VNHINYSDKVFTIHFPAVNLILCYPYLMERRKMKVRTDIKAGSLVQNATQQADDIFKKINRKLNKPRVSISRWGDVQESQVNNL